MQQFFKDDENCRFCSLETDGIVVCFKMRTSQNSLCFGCVCVCAASNSGSSTEHYSNNTFAYTHFTWCWIGRNRPNACPLCFTGLTLWNFSFGAVWNTLCAPNLLLIIRTCVAESQKLFRLWNPILLNVPVFGLIFDWTWFVQQEVFMRELIKKNP